MHRINLLFVLLSQVLLWNKVCNAQEPAKSPLKLGIIGLDTSHVQAFTKQINRPDPKKPPLNLKVIAAFPGGSEDLPSSRDRVAGFTKQLREMDVEIVDSIEALLPKVDAVLLESVDGRKHLEQAVPVFRAGKRVFIDKPLAANLTDAIAIDLVAKHYKANWFSSSSLRFSESIRKFRDDQAYSGKIHGAVSWGPCSIDATHVDHYWYGIHGVESLYTAMGIGCQSVAQTSTNGADTVVGVWNDGRTGVFRGIRAGSSGFGMVVFSDKKIETDSKFDGYEPLVYEIDKFLSGGPQPVSNEETLEIMTFMQAAYESKNRGGQSVKLSEIWQQHRDAAEKIAAKIVAP
ncbi:MAG: Gfo/Idh/MocA family oxidoreductase [Pirellulales bacterium]